MTNDAAECAIRPLAVGRCNWAFTRSDAGGHRPAATYSLIETARLKGLNSEAYLRDVIGRIATTPSIVSLNCCLGSALPYGLPTDHHQPAAATRRFTFALNLNGTAGSQCHF